MYTRDTKLYVCMYIYVCMYVCICIYVYIYMCVCVCVCAHKHVHTYTHTYIHTYREPEVRTIVASDDRCPVITNYRIVPHVPRKIQGSVLSTLEAKGGVRTRTHRVC
jgi:hypothetical protein